MIKILFVCTGNICRSPLAEGILREKLRKRKISALVDSCGFEPFHVGDSPDPRAQQVAAKRGIDISSHRARLFTTGDFDRFDRIYAMDSGHMVKIGRQSRNGHDLSRADLVMNVIMPGRDLEVPDPWYDDMRAFEEVFQQLDEACDGIVDLVISESGKNDRH